MITMSYDLHTHSTYSDGKDTLAVNIETAISRGLTKIGLTDHAYCHMSEGIRLKKMDQYIKDAYAMKAAYKDDIEVLVGMEYNILNLNGDTDILDAYKDAIELKLLGVHKAARYSNFKSYYYFLFIQIAQRARRRADVVQAVTDAHIKAFERYKIDIFAHPGSLAKLDVGRLAEVCAAKNIKMEINARHQDWTESDVRAALDTKVEFILGSDAHWAKAVGEHGYADAFIRKHGIPLNRVVNAADA